MGSIPATLEIYLTSKSTLYGNNANFTENLPYKLDIELTNLPVDGKHVGKPLRGEASQGVIEASTLARPHPHRFQKRRRNGYSSALGTRNLKSLRSRIPLGTDQRSIL